LKEDAELAEELELDDELAELKEEAVVVSGLNWPLLKMPMFWAAVKELLLLLLELELLEVLAEN
jgi:hypothetical protein